MLNKKVYQLYRYLGAYIIRVTTDYSDRHQLDGIYLNCPTRLVYYNDKYVLTRPLLREDLRDETYLASLLDSWQDSIMPIEDFLRKGRICEYRGSFC